jgi:hypothetical protein
MTTTISTIISIAKDAPPSTRHVKNRPTATPDIDEGGRVDDDGSN